MKNSEICDYMIKMNFVTKDIDFQADICPNYMLSGSSVSLTLDNITFKSIDTNIPNYYTVEKGRGISVSGSGILVLSNKESNNGSKEYASTFYTLNLFNSNVAKANLASLTFYSIDEVGAIQIYSISFISKLVNISIESNLEQYTLDPLKNLSVDEEKDIYNGKVIIIKNDQIEVRKL